MPIGTKTLLRLAGAAAVLVAAGCGGAPHRTAAPPPIRAVDAAPPPLVLEDLRMTLGLASAATATTTSVPTSFVCDAGGGRSRPCTKAEIARIGAVTRFYDRATTPTRVSAVRVVAVLRLPHGYRELLLAWPTRSGRLCLSVADELGGGTSYPFGPCLGAHPGMGRLALGGVFEPCAAICVASWTVETGFVSQYVLAGAVAPGATALRVTVGGGAVTTYPLRGPQLRGTQQRVFMAVVGHRSWRRLELLRGKTVVATQVMPARVAAFQDCTELLANNLTKLKACSAKARAMPGP